jgi:5,5'-dehydrodivanillate O-demethylase
LLPKDDLFVREDGFRQILAHRLPCNWLQVMENRGDPGHVYYTHGEFGQYIAERRSKKIGMIDTERDESFAKPIAAMRARGAYPKHRYIPNAYGYTKASLASDRSENEGGPVWTYGMNPILFPYQLVLMPLSGDGFPIIKRAYQIGVPIDDTTTWHIYYLCYTFPPAIGIPHQASIPYREIPLQDESGEFILDYTTGQDMVMWYAQGDITDRSEEHLGVSDSVIIAYRKLLGEQIDIVGRGGEPMNVFRDAAAAYKREKNLPCSQMLETNTNILETAGDQGGRPGGWVDLNLGGDIGRYCPDKAILEDLYQKTLRLWGAKNQSRQASASVK